MNSRQRFASVAAGAWLVACAGTFQSPAEGGAQWVELRSKHIVLHTDASPEHAERVVSELEEFRTALERIAFPSPDQPHDVLRIALFANDTEYDEIAPSWTAGEFRTAGIENEPIVLLRAHQDEHAHITIQHELVHRYTAFHIPNAPVWLDEGLAAFYSTLHAEGGSARVGETPDPLFLALRPGLRVNLQGTRVELADYVPSVRNLLHMSSRDFHVPRDGGAARRAANYGTSWALVHALALGNPARQRQFSRYLNLLTSGSATSERAWQQTFAADEPALQRAVEDVLEGEHSLGKLRFETVSPPHIAALRMAPAAVHRLWATLRRWNSEADRARARQDIDKAIQLEPRSGENYLLLGLWFAAQQHATQAEAAFRRALSLEPNNARCLAALASFYLSDEEPAPAIVQETIKDLVERLEPLARSAVQLNLVAWFWATRHEPKRGLPFAKRALETDSSCAACYDTLALLEFEDGDLVDSAENQRIAVNLSEAQHGEVVERLNLFQRSLSELKTTEAGTNASEPTANRRPPALDPSCERAQLTNLITPSYPEPARRNEIEGVVKIRFVVTEQGKVSDVLSASGPSVLAEVAIKAVRQWQFVPANCARRPVVSEQSARIPFRLKDASPHD